MILQMHATLTVAELWVPAYAVHFGLGVCARRAMLVRNTYYDSSGKEQLIGVMLNAMLCSERMGCDRNVPSGTAGSRSVLDGMVRATNCIFIATVRMRTRSSVQIGHQHPPTTLLCSSSLSTLL